MRLVDFGESELLIVQVLLKLTPQEAVRAGTLAQSVEERSAEVRTLEGYVRGQKLAQEA